MIDRKENYLFKTPLSKTWRYLTYLIFKAIYQNKMLVFGKMNNHKGKTYYEENAYIFLKDRQRQIKMTLFMESVKIFVLI